MMKKCLFKRDTFLGRLKKWWTGLWCKHRHTVRFNPFREELVLTKDGIPRITVSHIVFEGCLDCGFVRVFNMIESEQK